MQIVTQNLSFSYGKDNKKLSVKALDGVSVEIREGDFFGIIGHTGSGKSTFLQHLNGLIKLQKDSGSIVIGDFDFKNKKCDFNFLRSKIGMVFQYPEYQLFADTIYEDVAFGLRNFYPDIHDEEERVKEAMELVGLEYDRVKGKSPFDLSGGQKRRVAIAGVIVSKPEILILDEPVAGLDPKGKREFIALLKKLQKEFVKTVVIVSHDMNLIAENCNRAVVLNKGKVYKEGSPKEIFSDSGILGLGLELPVTAYLTEKLKEKGVIIDNDFTADDFVNKTSEYFKGEKR